MTQSKDLSLIGSLRDKLAVISPEIEKSLDKLLANTFGIMLTFLSNELTAQQRQIWLSLAQCYPDPKSGAELALLTGSSKSSKSIYKSIDALKSKDMIIVHQPHPKTFSIQANPDHPMTRILIDFCTYYGRQA